MDRRTNPFAPGAGTPPPELAGRDEVIEEADIALHRMRNGLSAKGFLMAGLRGVGKTVLLNRIQSDADGNGIEVVSIEVPEQRSLPAALAGPLNGALVRMRGGAAAVDLARRARRALAGFARAMKLTYHDVTLSIDLDAEEGVADSGDLDTDLTALVEVAGAAARAHGTVLLLAIDEMQNIETRQLGALIAALHRSAQRQWPVLLIGSGLPQLIGHIGAAKSYAERMFLFPAIGPLSDEAAAVALQAPARRLGVTFSREALDSIIRITEGYPYFLQEWGSACWRTAAGPVISVADLEAATPAAVEALDNSFFRVRLERTSPFERRYLRAMARMGPGPHRSGEIAEIMGRKVQAVAPTRARLIAKGLIYSPAHGDTAFTVPLFDQYLTRTMRES